METISKSFLNAGQDFKTNSDFQKRQPLHQSNKYISFVHYFCFQQKFRMNPRTQAINLSAYRILTAPGEFNGLSGRFPLCRA